MSEAGEQGTRVGRRRLLGAGLGALFGAIVGRTGTARAETTEPPPQLPPGRPLLLEQTNVARAPTTLMMSGEGPAVVFVGPAGANQPPPVTATAEVAGVIGSSGSIGVIGVGGDNPGGPTLTAGVVGRSGSVGVVGVGESTGGRHGVIGVVGVPPPVTSTPSVAGVVGASDAIGVVGIGPTAPQNVTATAASAGVVGTSDAIGVLGASAGGLAATMTARAAGVMGVGAGTAVGVLAGNAGSGLALDVAGRTRLGTAGRATIPRRQRSAFVANTAVTANSVITVTPTSPVTESFDLRWVERQPGRGFVVHLNDAHRDPVEISYLIVEGG